MTEPAAPVPDGQVRLSVDAMGTRFELIYWGPRGGGEDALAEIGRLESKLSASQSSSDVAWINAHAGLRAVKVEPRTFTLLQRCVELSEETEGAFDITVGPLLQVWTFASAGGKVPTADMLADARERVGYRHLQLDPQSSTIRFARPAMRLDLNAVQKGYAVDAAMTVLRAHGVQTALLRGGTSNAHAIGEPPEGAWTVPWPAGRKTLTLRNSASSVSAVQGRSFAADGRHYAHVFDARKGEPAAEAQSAIVTGPCSLECDALSTALLVRGRAWLPAMRKRFPGYDGDLA